MNYFSSVRRRRRAVRLAAVAGAALAMFGAVDALGADSSRGAAPQFVRRYRNILLVGEQRFRFTGLNIYNANSNGSCAYPMATGDALARSLRALTGRNRVIRAWFFQNMATTDGVRDWKAFDHTLAVARAHGVRVIPVLANQWSNCDTSGFKNPNWYVSGYKLRADGDLVSYRSWVAAIGKRYRADPTILAWQLINEAQVSNDDGSCTVNGGAILKAWAADVSTVLKAVDPRHLVSIGTVGDGRCGTTGRDYLSLYSLPTVDLCEYHDYGSLSPMPGYGEQGLQTRIAQCNLLGKPLFVGESGIRVDALANVDERAAAFDRKFQAQFAAGVVGELVWNWDLYGSRAEFDVGPGDPTLNVLARYGTPAPAQ